LAAEASTKQELELSIPWEEVEKEADRIAGEFRRKAKIPGFRPGKAPASVIKTRFKSEIEHEVLEQLIPEHFWNRAREEKLRVVGTPNITGVEFESGRPLSFRAEFEVMPEFELGEYRRLPVAFDWEEVTGENVNAELERLREQHASYRNLDPRPLQDGDIAVVALRSEPAEEGVPRIDNQETTIEIGASDALPEFSDNLRGKSPGEEAAFEVRYPDDFATAELAGKTVRFDATVKGLRQKELPELDDDFASDVGEFKSLDELRSRIREVIEQRRRHAAAETAKESLIDQLVEKHDFPVPERLVEQQIARRVERQLRGLAQEGVDPSQMDINWEEVREKIRPEAVRAVKAGMLLERIADVENIQAAREEIDEQVERMAAQQGKPVSDVRAELAREGTLDRIAAHIRNEKTLNFLLDEAEKTGAEAAPD